MPCQQTFESTLTHRALLVSQYFCCAWAIQAAPGAANYLQYYAYFESVDMMNDESAD